MGGYGRVRWGRKGRERNVMGVLNVDGPVMG